MFEDPKSLDFQNTFTEKIPVDARRVRKKIARRQGPENKSSRPLSSKPLFEKVFPIPGTIILVLLSYRHTLNCVRLLR